MKSLIITICVLIHLPLFAQEEGVKFRDLTYKQALAAAKKEGKLVFMDCYTSWCGPCKHMANVIFPQKEAGDYFNSRFICVKYDMEKGEGVELKKRFNIDAFPTFMLIRPDGIVQHRIVGGDELVFFIERVEQGLNENTCLLSLEQAYEQGKLDNKRMLDYRNMLFDIYQKEKATRVYQELWNRLSDEEKTSPEFWSLYGIEDEVVKSPAFEYLLRNVDLFRKNMGRENVDDLLMKYCRTAIYHYLWGENDENDLSIELMEELLPGLELPNQARLNQLMGLAAMSDRHQLDQLILLINRKLEDWSTDDVGTYLSVFKQLAQDENEQIQDVYTKYVDMWCNRIVEKMEKDEPLLNPRELTYRISNLQGLRLDINQALSRRVLAVCDKVIARSPKDEIAENPWFMDSVNYIRKQAIGE